MIELSIVGSILAALIDDEFEHFKRFKWRIHPKGYVYRYSETKIKLAHAVVGAPPEGCGVFHKNNDRMDYRRLNLVTETAENYRRRSTLKRDRESAAQGKLFCA